jgi:hypothetical protein
MRSYLRFASVIGAATMSAIAAAPAMAAAPLSQAGANAVTVSIAGNEQGTGNVTAKNDGTGEKKTGDASPPLSMMKNQALFNGGVLAQEATASAAGGTGHSAACAGLTGNGGSVAQIGDSSCLNPGDPVGLSFGNLDFSKVAVIDPNSAFGPASPANAGLRTLLTSVADPIRQGLAASPLATTGLTGSLGVVESRCTAGAGSADGNAVITDSQLTLDLAGQKIVLVDLPTHPAPNTHVPVDLDKATGAIITALNTQLTSMLAAPGADSGPLAPLTQVTNTVQNQVIKAVVDATREQLLKPLAENVLDLVLNKQTRTGTDPIRVSAIDLSVLPAARAQLGSPLAEVQIANVVCGPSGRVVQAAAAPQAPSAALPTGVSAGLATVPGQHAPGNDSHNGIVLAALAIMLAGGTALVGVRWLRG